LRGINFETFGGRGKGRLGSERKALRPWKGGAVGLLIGRREKGSRSGTANFL